MDDDRSGSAPDTEPPPPLPSRDTTVQPSAGLEEVADRGADRVVALLKAGVPLSLLLDLADPAGPDSTHLYQQEPGDTSWLERRA